MWRLALRDLRCLERRKRRRLVLLRGEGAGRFDGDDGDGTDNSLIVESPRFEPLVIISNP